MKSRLLLVMPLLALAACISPADHPTLAPRPIEQALGPLPSTAPARPVVDPAVMARAASLVAEAQAAATRFDVELVKVEAAVSQASGAAANSEAWVAAEQMLSRAEAARAPLATRLADLDRIMAGQGGDEALARQVEALATVEARQRAALVKLEAALSRP